MKLVKNEKGLTLIEVLASIVILSIVLISIMNFFPQIGFMNNQNANKSQAVNTAKQVLINWQNDEGVQGFLKGSQTAVLPVQPSNNPDTNYYYFQTTYRGYIVNIKIAKNSPANFPSGSTAVRYIQVHIQNTQNNVASDTYGYITLD